MRVRWYIAFLLIIATSSAASASAPVNIKQYLALRKKVLSPATLSTIKSDASAYVGKTVEIRGTVSGFSRNGEGGSIILTTSEGSFLINTDSLPSENPGMDLACLVKVGQTSVGAPSELTLVACTYDVDLKRLEESAKKAAQAKAQAAKPKTAPQVQKRPTEPASRHKVQQMTVDEFIRAYKNAIKGFNRKLTDSQADTIARSVLGFSSKYKVDPRLVCAVILAESHFRINATSSCGAQGLGQLMPATAAGMGVDNAYDPVANVYGSVRYIRGMLDRMSGNKKWTELTWSDLALAIAAYNAGPGAVKKHGGIPPYKETQSYVKRVVSIYKKLCGVK
ncbi:MAG: lytic transglycosylase domain-containing protein [Armatimonadota bacterium]|nr:lytic transglycosylase domain-containing protein [bacterium]